MRIKGQTLEDRRAARDLRGRENRANLFRQRILASTTGREVLIHACDYLKAVAKHQLDDAGRRELARQLVAMADERNQS